MDGYQDLTKPLVINSEYSELDIGAMNVVDQSINDDLLIEIESLDLNNVLHSVEDLGSVPLMKTQEVNLKIKSKILLKLRENLEIEK